MSKGNYEPEKELIKTAVNNLDLELVKFANSLRNMIVSSTKLLQEIEKSIGQRS